MRRWRGLLVAATMLAAVSLIVALGWFRTDDRTDATASPGTGLFSKEMLQDLLESAGEDAFERPSGSWDVSLPSDYGSHAGARSETWMIAAHVDDGDGEVMGLHFSLTRLGLKPGAASAEAPSWEPRSIYRAEVALTRGDGKEVIAEERFSRGAGTAGHDATADEIWLDDWILSYGDETGRHELGLSVSFGDVVAGLELTPVKSAVQIGGDDSAPFRGFVVPRLSVDGEIKVGGTRHSVTGTAWIDRAWGELPLPGGPLVYDRLILQLDDRTDLSLVRTSRRQGRGSAVVDELAIAPDGLARTLGDDDLELMPTAFWTSGDGEARYPVAWNVTSDGIILDVEMASDDPGRASPLAGLTGLVRAEGQIDGEAVSGLGTLQMTGYEDR